MRLQDDTSSRCGMQPFENKILNSQPHSHFGRKNSYPMNHPMFEVLHSLDFTVILRQSFHSKVYPSMAGVLSISGCNIISPSIVFVISNSFCIISFATNILYKSSSLYYLDVSDLRRWYVNSIIQLIAKLALQTQKKPPRGLFCMAISDQDAGSHQAVPRWFQKDGWHPSL